MNELTEADMLRFAQEGDGFHVNNDTNALVHPGCGEVHVWPEDVTPTPWAYRCAAARHLRDKHPPEVLLCSCGKPAKIVVTVEVIGSPNLTSHKPKCKETCDG